MKEEKLLLFANSKHKEQYILDNFINKTIETTNLTTLNNFLNIILNTYKSASKVDVLSSDFSVFYIEQSIEEYKKINSKSIFVKQPDYYKLSNDIYSLYSELTIASFLSADKLFFEQIKENKNIEEVFSIIEIYNSKLKSENKCDEVLLYSNFINALNLGSIKHNLLDYNTLEVIGFENLAYRYLAFLSAIKNGYNKNINIALPYDNNILSNYKKNISDFNILQAKNISGFANSIINDNSKIKDYKDNIHFITGFGIKQECYTAIDKVIELINNGHALYDIALVFDNTEDYHDLITSRLSQCKIEYDERLGYPIWQVPVIPIITSIFSVINIFEGEREVNIEGLIKILSSGYISIEGLDNSKVRDLFYNKLKMFETMPEKNFEYRLSKSHNDVELDSFCLIVKNIYNCIKDISTSNSFTDITNTYKQLLQKFNLANSIKKNSSTYLRDNNALAQFIEKLNELTTLKISTDYKDYYTVLNIMLREGRLDKKNSNEKGITLLSSYDARGLNFKHLIIVGVNSSFLIKRPSTFILDEKLRTDINKKYSRNIISSVTESNNLSRSFFYSMVSNLGNDSNIYFSFRYKDENGSLELPSIFVEEIFYLLTESAFNFDNLKKYGATFRKDYISRDNLIHTEQEALISLFYYKELNKKLPKNTIEINNSLSLRTLDGEDKEIMKVVCKEIFSNVITVSDIEAMLGCEQSFVDSKMFPTSSIDERTIGIDSGLRGDIYHHCFFKLYETIKEKYGLPLNINKLSEYKKIISEIIANLEREKAYKLYDEKEIDKESLKNEVEDVLNLYIEKEIEHSSVDINYIPDLFEYSFNNYILYKTNSGIEIKLKGRIDRIDFHYDNNKNINGVRIVDYKPNADKIEAKNLSDQIQLLLYLDLIVSDRLKNNSAINNLEIAYSSYSYKKILSDYFDNFSNTDELKNVLYNKEEGLKTKIFRVMESMLEGNVDYNPSADNCKNCQKRSRCLEVFSDY